ncbi:MAG: ACP S-malonyltransferase [Pseudomonadota bacterium]
MTKTAVIICPGRGTYNKDELGYLGRHHGNRARQLAEFDAYRQSQGQPTLSALDAADRFSAARHTSGDNASPLIYAASLFDAQAVADDYDVLAVTGNSMGWYSALAVAGAMSAAAGLQIVNTMGTLMQERMIGGQTLYPFVDDNWVPKPGLRDQLLALVAKISARPDHALDISIHLGGMLVVAGDEAGLTAFEDAVAPQGGRYPMRLPGHAAFHTGLQGPVSEAGKARLAVDLFENAKLPLIDGRGAVWQPGTYTATELWDYTIGHQVLETYDFTGAVQVAAHSFAPDVFIITGPGTTLGGAVAQSLLACDWDAISTKDAFLARQAEAPLILSMGREDQRASVVGA